MRSAVASVAIVAALGVASAVATWQLDTPDAKPVPMPVYVWHCGQLATDTPVSCWVGP